MVHREGQYISWAWAIRAFRQVWILWVNGQSSSAEIILGLGEEVYRTQHEGLQPRRKYLRTRVETAPSKINWNVRGRRITSRVWFLFVHLWRYSWVCWNWCGCKDWAHVFFVFIIQYVRFLFVHLWRYSWVCWNWCGCKDWAHVFFVFITQYVRKYICVALKFWILEPKTD